MLGAEGLQTSKKLETGPQWAWRPEKIVPREGVQMGQLA
jgi:hypothetical protein